MQRTLRSPGLFTWNPSVSWVVGVRCHCTGSRAGSPLRPIWAGGTWGSRAVPIQICTADGTMVSVLQGLGPVDGQQFKDKRGLGLTSTRWLSGP